MWYFDSPHVVFGEEALSHLAQLSGRLAFIVTDQNIVRLGADAAGDRAARRGRHRPRRSSTEIEPEPSLQMVQRCAAVLAQHQPDWIIGLGGGSCMDAAKAAWLLYENPGVDLASVNPFDQYAHAREGASHRHSHHVGHGLGSDVVCRADRYRRAAQGRRRLAQMLPDLAISIRS